MRHKLSILIIDDDRVSQIYLGELIDLIIENVHVVKADGGEKAIELLKKQSFHFIFSDILMPGLSEEKLFCELKDAVKQSPTTKIIAVSGIEDIEEIKKLAPGASMVLKKPIDRDVLKKILLEEGVKVKDVDSEDSETIVMDLNLLVKLYQNKPDKLLNLLNLYRNTLPKQFSALKNAFNEENSDLVKTNAHSLKNSFAYLGAASLRTKALYVEENAKNNNNPARLQANVNDIISSESMVINKIEELIRSYE
jgi:YesN/AraC family two-component response regulator